MKTAGAKAVRDALLGALLPVSSIAACGLAALPARAEPGAAGGAAGIAPSVVSLARAEASRVNAELQPRFVELLVSIQRDLSRIGRDQEIRTAAFSHASPQAQAERLGLWNRLQAMSADAFARDVSRGDRHDRALFSVELILRDAAKRLQGSKLSDVGGLADRIQALHKRAILPARLHTAIHLASVGRLGDSLEEIGRDAQSAGYTLGPSVFTSIQAVQSAASGRSRRLPGLAGRPVAEAASRLSRKLDQALNQAGMGTDLKAGDISVAAGPGRPEETCSEYPDIKDIEDACKRGGSGK